MKFDQKRHDEKLKLTAMKWARSRKIDTRQAFVPICNALGAKAKSDTEAYAWVELQLANWMRRNKIGVWSQGEDR
jgi:hypothetical protein